MTTTFREQPKKERYLRIVTLETFAQSDCKTWPDQQKYSTFSLQLYNEHVNSILYSLL